MQLGIFLDVWLVDWSPVVVRLMANVINRTVTDVGANRAVSAQVVPARVVEMRDDPAEVGEKQQRHENAGQAAGRLEDSGLHRVQGSQASRLAG